MSEPSIDSDTLVAVRSLFELKNWEVDETVYTDPTQFNRFCETLTRLSADEKEFLIWHTLHYNDYPWLYVQNAVVELIRSLAWKREAHDGVTIFPVIDPTPQRGKGASQAKVKSGPLLTNFLSGNRRELAFRNLDPLNFPERLDDYLSYHRERPRSRTIIIDDYAGSGDSIYNFLQFLRRECPDLLTDGRCCIITPVAHDMAIARLKAEPSVLHLFKTSSTYSISNNSAYSDSKARYLSLMQSMGTKVRCPSDYQLGYKGCEDVVTIMDRTPNNTLGIYWFETRTNNAPFPRKKKPR